MRSRELWAIERAMRNAPQREAPDIVKEAIERPGHDASALLSALQAYYADDYDGALRLARQAEGPARRKRRMAEVSWACRVQSSCWRMLDRYQEALAAANAAIEAAPGAWCRARALTAKTQALRLLSRHDSPLAVAEAAVEAAPDAATRAHALTRQADVLTSLSRYRDALKAAEEAADAARRATDDRGLSYALTSRATALYLLARYDQALEAAEAAEEAARAASDDRGIANALTSQSAALNMKGKHRDAIDKAEAALPFARRAEYRRAEAYAQFQRGIAAADEGAEATRQDALGELRQLMPLLHERLAAYRPKWSARAARIWTLKTEHEHELRRHLRHPPTHRRRKPLQGELSVLRKWASYTAIPLLRYGRQGDTGIGGGYFLRWGNWGLVIDPGLGFGQSFCDAGFVPRDIDAVAVTHHHIDHTGDMLPLTTCLFEMQEESPSDPPAVDFYLAPGAFSAFSGLLAHAPGVNSVTLLRPGEEAACGRGRRRVVLRAVEAHHRDLTGHTGAAIGLVIELRDAGGLTCRVGLTGDTRYSEGLARQFRGCHLLVLHVGSAYRRDLYDPESLSTHGPAASTDTGQEGHLGLSGAVQLLRDIREQGRRMPLAVLSEWGEELDEARLEICDFVADRADMEGRVWPAELRASFALGRDKARPICGACRRQVASTAVWTNAGDIEYRCNACAT